MCALGPKIVTKTLFSISHFLRSEARKISEGQARSLLSCKAFQWLRVLPVLARYFSNRILSFTRSIIPLISDNPFSRFSRFSLFKNRSATTSYVCSTNSAVSCLVRLMLKNLRIWELMSLEISSLSTSFRSFSVMVSSLVSITYLTVSVNCLLNYSVRTLPKWVHILVNTLINLNGSFTDAGSTPAELDFVESILISLFEVVALS